MYIPESLKEALKVFFEDRIDEENEEIKKFIDDFNQANPVGTQVTYFPTVNDDQTIWKIEGKRAHTKCRAFLCSSGHPAIFCEGIPGFLILLHIEVYDPEAVPYDNSVYSDKFGHLWNPIEDDLPW